MKCSVFIATSADGFIATKDGGVDWLHSAGNGKERSPENADMGFNKYLASVDCLIMGRKSMEVISNMNLSRDQWPYGNLRIIVLSNTLKEAPESLYGKAEVFSGDLLSLIAKLEAQGHKHAYIDGGTTIQAFLKLQLISEMVITKAPLVLGEGIPLFAKVEHTIKMEGVETINFENGYVLVKCELMYPSSETSNSELIV